MTVPEMSDEELWLWLLERVKATEPSVKTAVLNVAEHSMSLGNRDYDSAAQIATWLYPWLRWTLCAAFRKAPDASWANQPSNFLGYCFKAALRRLNTDRDDAASIAARHSNVGRPTVTFHDPATLPHQPIKMTRPFANLSSLEDAPVEELERALGSFEKLRQLLADDYSELDIEIFRLKYFATPHKTDVEIADALSISKNTVRNRMKPLFRSLSFRLVKMFDLDPSVARQIEKAI